MALYLGTVVLLQLFGSVEDTARLHLALDVPHQLDVFVESGC